MDACALEKNYLKRAWNTINKNTFIMIVTTVGGEKFELTKDEELSLIINSILFFII
jgi:hypothetical protein